MIHFYSRQQGKPVKDVSFGDRPGVRERRRICPAPYDFCETPH